MEVGLHYNELLIQIPMTKQSAIQLSLGHVVGSDHELWTAVILEPD